MAFALRGPELTPMDLVADELKLAAELGLRTSVHIETGGTRRPIAELHEQGLLRDTTTFVHANRVGDDELRMLADAGSSVSVSPDVELKMGIGWPETGRMLAAGLRPALSTDDCPAAGGDMFSTMRTAYVVQRGLDGCLRSRDLLDRRRRRRPGVRAGHPHRQHHSRQGRRPDPVTRRRPDHLPGQQPGWHDRRRRPSRLGRHGPGRRLCGQT